MQGDASSNNAASGVSYMITSLVDSLSSNLSFHNLLEIATHRLAEAVKDDNGLNVAECIDCGAIHGLLNVVKECPQIDSIIVDAWKIVLEMLRFPGARDDMASILLASST